MPTISLSLRYDEWEKFSQELQDMDITVDNFTSALKTVDQRIQVQIITRVSNFPTPLFYRFISLSVIVFLYIWGGVNGKLKKIIEKNRSVFSRFCSIYLRDSAVFRGKLFIILFVSYKFV